MHTVSDSATVGLESLESRQLLSVAWGTYLGAAGDDTAWSVAATADGGAVVVGQTKSAGWTRDGQDTTFNDPEQVATDGFVARYAADGTMQWSTYLGGTDYDEAYAVALDPAGNIYVSGYSESADWLTDADGLDPDASVYFLAKLSPSGVLQWSTDVGMGGGENYTAVAVGDGGVFVAGLTFQANRAVGGHDTTINGDADAFVVRLTLAGQPVWSTYLGGAYFDAANGLTFSGGALYVSGESESTDWSGAATPASPDWARGGVDTTHNGGRDVFVAKLDPAGGANTLAWSTFLGGPATEYGGALAPAPDGGVYVGGDTNSAGWARGGYDTTIARVPSGQYESSDGFVARLRPDGGTDGLAWSTYLGGTGHDDVGRYGLAPAPGGGVLVSGSTASDGWAVRGSGTTRNGKDDAFLAELAPGGGPAGLVSATYLGGSEPEYGRGVAAGPNGAVLVVGSTRSAGWLSGGDDPIYGNLPTQDDHGGDGFLLRIHPSTPPPAGPDLTITDPTGSATDRAVQFEPVALGDASLPIIVTLDNTGDEPLFLTAPMVDGAAAGDFELLLRDERGQVVSGPDTTIPPGAAFKLEARFRPTAAGVRAAAVRFTTDSRAPADRDVTLQLTGTGIAADAPGLPQLTWRGKAAPSVIRLRLPAGKRRMAEVFTLANLGGADLTVTGLATTPAALFRLQTATPPLGVTLPPAGTPLTFRVVFTPNAPGRIRGTLTLQTDAGTRQIRLVGIRRISS